MLRAPSQASYDSGELPPTETIRFRRTRGPKVKEVEKAAKLRGYIKKKNENARSPWGRPGSMQPQSPQRRSRPTHARYTKGDVVEIPDSEDERQQEAPAAWSQPGSQTPGLSADSTEEPLRPKKRRRIARESTSPECALPTLPWLAKEPEPEPESRRRPEDQTSRSQIETQRPPPSEASRTDISLKRKREKEWLSGIPGLPEDQSIDSTDLTSENIQSRSPDSRGGSRTSQPRSSRAQRDRGGGVSETQLDNFGQTLYDTDIEFGSSRAGSEFRRQVDRSGRTSSVLRQSMASSPPPRQDSTRGLSIGAQIREREIQSAVRREDTERERLYRRGQQSRVSQANRIPSPDPSEVYGARVSDIASPRRGRPPSGVRGLDLIPASFYTARQADERRKLEEMRQKVREEGPQPTNKRFRPKKEDAVDRRKCAVKWNEREIGRLVGLYQKYPQQWSMIKQVDEMSLQPLLGIRTQVDLKDKIRTIKRWLLRNGFEIPNELGMVKLSDNDIQMIANHLG